ncbi:MAG: hypothetical protein SchgKO_25030 [Schleiferiaceae bacterium]
MNLIWMKSLPQTTLGGFIDIDDQDNLIVGYSFRDKAVINDIGLAGNSEVLDTTVEAVIVRYSPSQDSIHWKIQWDDLVVPSNTTQSFGLRLRNSSVSNGKLSFIAYGTIAGDYHPGLPYEYNPVSGSHDFSSYIMVADLDSGEIIKYKKTYRVLNVKPILSNNEMVVSYYKASPYNFDLFDGISYVGDTNTEQRALYFLDSNLNVINKYFLPYHFNEIIAGPLGTWYGIGAFSGTVDFNPKAGSLLLTSDSTLSSDREDIFVSQFDTTGIPLWIKRYGGKARDYGLSISPYREKDLVMAGMYITETQFDTASSSILTPEGLHDGFVIRINQNGDYVSGISLGGSGSDYIYKLSGNRKGQMGVLGYYSGQMDADPDSIGVATLTASSNIYPGWYAPFIATYCDTTQSTLSVTGCGGFYTSPSGKVWTVPGTYADTVANAFGCDSLMTIHLTAVNAPFSTTIVLNGATFSTSTQADTYQWIDCTTWQEIQGADSSHFTATSNGTYALIMEVDGCIDTSACMSINNIGLGEFEVLKYSVYPNPTGGLVTIKGNEQESFPLLVTVLDLSGREIYHDEIEKQTLNLSHLKSGVYVLSVNDASGHSEVHRLVIN